MAFHSAGVGGCVHETVNSTLPRNSGKRSSDIDVEEVRAGKGGRGGWTAAGVMLVFGSALVALVLTGGSEAGATEHRQLPATVWRLE